MAEIKADDIEEWRPVCGHDGYEVSSAGRVASWKPVRNGASLPTERRLLKLSLDKDGYKRGVFYHAGKKSYFRTCRLVALAWHGVPKIGDVVRHLDGSKSNDTPRNLAWGTPKENSADCIMHGTMTNGSKTNTSRLSEAQVIEVLSSPLGHSELARRFGVTPGAIWHIRAKRSWKHVERV